MHPAASSLYRYLLPLILLVLGVGWLWQQNHAVKPLRIGFLYSSQGPLAALELSLLQAGQLAVKQINQDGGLLGQPLVLEVLDCPSATAGNCARAARQLLEHNHVLALFGCWQAECRQQIAPEIERRQALYFDITPGTGEPGQDSYILLGAAPNQWLIPAVRWAQSEFGSRLYLITDDTGAGTAILGLTTALVQQQGSTLLGTRALPLDLGPDNPALQSLLDELQTQPPQAIINTLTGPANQALFTALHASSPGTRQIPVISTQLDNIALNALAARQIAGHYLVSSYSPTLPTADNRRFVDAVAQLRVQPPDAAFEASYLAIKLWAQASQAALQTDAQSVRQFLPGQSLNAPEGQITLHRTRHHFWRSMHIARIGAEKQLELLWSSATPVEPQPTWQAADTHRAAGSD